MNTSYLEAPKSSMKVLMAVVFSVAVLVALLSVARPAHASTTFNVTYPYDTNDADIKDNLCDVATFIPGDQCTLRAAIEQSNATTGADTINFDIPGPGVHTIHVGATSPSNGNLPEITDTVTINGYSQQGSSVNTLEKGTSAKLMIELAGDKLGDNTCGSALKISAPDVVVKGLVINRFCQGIWLEPSSANSKVEGNFIGTDPSGTLDRGLAGTGVVVNHFIPHVPVNITIGGSPAARNLISGNGGWGIFLGQSDNAVYGNLIGTKRDGKSPLGNDSNGVAISGNHNVVGGSGPGAANTIAFNGDDGVFVEHDGFQNDGSGNVISSDSIFSNKGLGIDLGFDGSTPNDLKDPDTGANNLQNHPVITSAKKTSAGTTIKGKLNSTPSKTFTLQFFSNPRGNQGKKLLGQEILTTDASGNVSFTFSTQKATKAGQKITATAVDNSTWDTSEFSAPKKVVAS